MSVTYCARSHIVSCSAMSSPSNSTQSTSNRRVDTQRVYHQHPSSEMMLATVPSRLNTPWRTLSLPRSMRPVGTLSCAQRDDLRHRRVSCILSDIQHVCSHVSSVPRSISVCKVCCSRPLPAARLMASLCRSAPPSASRRPSRRGLSRSLLLFARLFLRAFMSEVSLSCCCCSWAQYWWSVSTSLFCTYTCSHSSGVEHTSAVSTITVRDPCDRRRVLDRRRDARSPGLLVQSSFDVKRLARMASQTSSIPPSVYA